MIDDRDSMLTLICIAMRKRNDAIAANDEKTGTKWNQRIEAYWDMAATILDEEEVAFVFSKARKQVGETKVVYDGSTET